MGFYQQNMRQTSGVLGIAPILLFGVSEIDEIVVQSVDYPLQTTGCTTKYNNCSTRKDQNLKIFYWTYYHAKYRRITPPECGDKSILHSTIQNLIQDPDSCAKTQQVLSSFCFKLGYRSDSPVLRPQNLYNHPRQLLGHYFDIIS